MRLIEGSRAMNQTVANLLVLFVSLSALTLALTVVSPLLSRYDSQNKIRQAEAIMTSLHNEILKVQEEPPGSKRKVEIELDEGGIDLLNDPPRIVMYVEVPREVAMEVEGMDFEYTSRGAKLRINTTLPFVERGFIGLGSNLVFITKTEDGRLNVTKEVYS